MGMGSLKLLQGMVEGKIGSHFQVEDWQQIKE
jgi:hypothetical protein